MAYRLGELSHPKGGRGERINSQTISPFYTPQDLSEKIPTKQHQKIYVSQDKRLFIKRVLYFTFNMRGEKERENYSA